MALIIIYKDKDSLQLHSFRTDEDAQIWKEINTDISIELEINPISRGAVNQVERHLIRMLTEDYIQKLKNEEEEVKRLLRLYEIGARR